MEFERSLVKTLVSALKKRLPVFQVLIGPRQIGKTTIARQVLKKLPYPSVYASADSPLPPGSEWIESQWRLAELELQKVRGWSESLKLHWDRARHEGKDIRVLILGSSALLLQEGLTESLAGRFF